MAFADGRRAKRRGLPARCGCAAVCPSRTSVVVTMDLHDEKVRLGELSDAVHTYAPGLPVWNSRRDQEQNAGVEGR